MSCRFAAVLPTEYATSGLNAPFALPFDELCNCDDPWIELAGMPGLLGGFFDIDGELHQFYVQLAVEAVDGTLTLMSTGFDEAVFEFPAADVPEPATLSLLAVGGAVAGARRRLRR